MQQPPEVSVQDFLNSYARIINQMLAESYQLGWNAGVRRGIEQTRAEMAKQEEGKKEKSDGS